MTDISSISFLQSKFAPFSRVTRLSYVNFFQVLEAEPLEPDNFVNIDWNALPQLVHPVGGELPIKRLEKKCQQLENLAAAVMSIYQKGDVIGKIVFQH